MGKQNKILSVLTSEQRKKNYGKENPKFYDHMLEQYKIYVEMTDRISSRRITVNSFFLSINTAIIALIVYIKNSNVIGFYGLVSLSGAILCFLWYRMIRSYRDLNSGKFKVIHEIENKLPISPYDSEWEAIGRGKNSKLYLPFTHIEMGIPIIFLSIHILVLLHNIPWKAILKVICIK